jgi:outer membrane protein OmpA-like peptidoglycan-associated protein
MTRVIFFIIGLVLAASAALAFHSCTRRQLDVDSTPGLVPLADGSVLVAPDGSVAAVLVNWLRDPAATRRRFEVGGNQFAPGATTPIAPAKVRLARLAQMLRAYPKVQVALIGATNPGSNAEKDQLLSEERARLCADLLVAAGVGRERLTTSGEGGKHPLYAPTSPAASHNDRIILVLNKTG